MSESSSPRQREAPCPLSRHTVLSGWGFLCSVEQANLQLRISGLTDPWSQRASKPLCLLPFSSCYGLEGAGALPGWAKRAAAYSSQSHALPRLVYTRVHISHMDHLHRRPKPMTSTCARLSGTHRSTRRHTLKYVSSCATTVLF